jgi:predicted enzyme related to lactoylglutathione lyase
MIPPRRLGSDPEVMRMGGGIGRLEAITIDCADPTALARFWAGLFDTEVDSVNEGDGPIYVDLRATPEVPTLRFQRVPEPKVAKNRVHLDIEVADLEEARARVEALGGRRISERFEEFGYRWIVMADPEGNELCLVTRAADDTDG